MTIRIRKILLTISSSQIKYGLSSIKSLKESLVPWFKYFSTNSSKKTKRLIKRGGKNYYEYRDTVITNNSPFKPEWIRQLCFVKNNDPQNKNLKWNKGHLLHQLTYFVGKVNFYYMDKKNTKKVAVMNTGDTMYISPYTPHTFASRDENRLLIVPKTITVSSPDADRNYF